MKKYLMTGMAALAICAAFTSCSKGTDLYNAEIIQENAAAKAQKSYADAFIATFGQPAANQDWGFGSRSNTRTADPRGNMWADEGWNVPPVITDAQKDIVRRYFQQNTPIGYDDPEWTDFWIQQVYKGGSNTENGSQTTEQYRIGNGDMVTGGDHMDHLCSKAEDGTEDHVNDFNNSDNNDWEGRMLMVGSSTFSFGYINSNATAIHYDKAALVKWDVIAQWAVDNGLEESVEKSVLNDGWNRSYMGFDWEQALPDDCYSPIYDYSAGWSADLPGGFPILGYNTFEFEGETYRFLSANSNQYAYDENEPTFGGKQNYNDRPSDDVIRQLLSLGYLPYSDTLKDWIKLSTGSDGYYSDWIVTLTEAEIDDTPDPTKIRIIAEDLNARAEEGNTGDSDWDFNDVVFDVEFTGDNTATITLLAAGGTLPLIVGVQNPVNGQSYPANEVHSLFQVDTDYMVNTKAEAKGLKGGDVALKPTINVTITGVKAQNGKNIPIYVEKVYNGTTQWVELTAITGEPAAKIGVDPTFKWCNERVDIRKRYENFVTWVRTTNPTIWWNGVQ